MVFGFGSDVAIKIRLQGEEINSLKKTFEDLDKLLLKYTTNEVQKYPQMAGHIYEGRQIVRQMLGKIAVISANKPIPLSDENSIFSDMGNLLIRLGNLFQLPRSEAVIGYFGPIYEKMIIVVKLLEDIISRTLEEEYSFFSSLNEWKRRLVPIDRSLQQYSQAAASIASHLKRK